MAAAPGAVTMMTINMSDNKKKKSSALNRRKNVQDIINKYRPDIIFAQEIGAPSKRRWKLDIDEGYQTRQTQTQAGVVAKMERLSVNDDEDEENSDAGIMYNLIFISEFDMRAKLKMVEKMRQTRDKKGNQVWQSNALDDLPARTCIVCIKCADKYILAISWHGKWVATDEVKIRTLDALMEFALLIREENKKEGTSIIIGGDFNLKKLSSMKISNPEFELRKYSAENARRSDEELVDFFLHTKEVQVTNVKVIEVPKDSEGKVFLDHDPISAEIRFVSSRGEE